MTTATAAAPAAPDLDSALYRKLAWRLIPFLFVAYIVAFLDRVNVGYAKLQMAADLKFSDEIYGLGAGMFFIGYFFFEVPSNLIGARGSAGVDRAHLDFVGSDFGVVHVRGADLTLLEHRNRLRFLPVAISGSSGNRVGDFETF